MDRHDVQEAITQYLLASRSPVTGFEIRDVHGYEGAGVQWALAEVRAGGLDAVQVVLRRQGPGCRWRVHTLGTSIDPREHDFPPELSAALW